MSANNQLSSGTAGFPVVMSASSPGNTSVSPDARIASPFSIESRENTLRNAVRKWYGPIECIDTAGRKAEQTRQDTMVQLLLRLHRLSCNLVPESARIPIQEQDVHSAIIQLNRLSIMLGCPNAAVLCYCEARAIRERDIRLNTIDPLQLRHLYSFHQDIPHEELSSLDIQRLRLACESADTQGIKRWFETVAQRKKVLPRDTPQFLRQLALDLWNSGHRDFLDTYGKELCVLDAALFESLGWESSRFFLALMKRLHGSVCKSASVFMTDHEIALCIEQARQLGDAAETIHFRALSTTYDASASRRLEATMLAASKENGPRIHKTTPLTPLERKRSVTVPPAYGSPEFFIQASTQHKAA